MPFEYEIKPEKKEKGFMILYKVTKATIPGVYGGWNAPHSTWQRAVDDFSVGVRAAHGNGDVYVYEGTKYTNPDQIIKALKEPK